MSATTGKGSCNPRPLVTLGNNAACALRPEALSGGVQLAAPPCRVAPGRWLCSHRVTGVQPLVLRVHTVLDREPVCCVSLLSPGGGCPWLLHGGSSRGSERVITLPKHSRGREGQDRAASSELSPGPSIRPPSLVLFLEPERAKGSGGRPQSAGWSVFSRHGLQRMYRETPELLCAGGLLTSSSHSDREQKGWLRVPGQRPFSL